MANEVLEYVGINTTRIQKSIKSEKPKFNINKSYDNADLYKIYKRINVSDIEILVSETDRTTDIKTRYMNSIPVQDFIKEYKDEFEKLAEKTSVDDIKELEDLQESFKDKIPYFVKYDKNYLWQIYYSNEDDKYFMLFPAKEGETEVLMYLLKKKLEKEDTKIFVPVCKEDYDEKIISNKKLSDIENYIWVFTAEWPHVYEIFDGEEQKLLLLEKQK